jgi:asparagine synthase (glutamine-hydrolysing)
MCGIAGFARLRLDREEASRVVAGMCDAMVRRGPDDQGTAVHPDACLGMRRLSIVDLVHGHQPMASDDSQIVLVYNGEIYNAPALRADLQREGVRFHTRSDTEVILRLYERDPDDVEPRLAGMWAFAIHDRRRKRLVLSRDRFGIKPLFLLRAGGGVAFASDLRCFDALRRCPGIDQAFALDTAAAHAMLAWGYVPEQRTIYRGVERVAPATRMTLDLDRGTLDARRTWTLVPSADAARAASMEDAVAIVEPLLRRAAREHLESDVPVAALLSGGIDSSLALAYAAEQSPSPLRAYAIGFREPRFDESPYARDVARKLGVELRLTMLDEHKLREFLADALLAYDEPFGDSSSLATYAVSRAVSQDHKVALTGDGGDEAFAGYKKYRILHARRWLRRVAPVRDGLAIGLELAPVRIDRTRGWTELLRTARRIARGLRGDDAHAYVALTQVAALDRVAPLLARPGGAEELERQARDRFEEGPGTELQKTLAADLWGPLPNDMLTKVDRASMACSLEARVPFLDHRVVEVGAGLPERYTLGGGGKAVTKHLFAKRFGDALAHRTKMGFGVPVERWLGASLAPACERLFERARLDRHGLLSAAALGDGKWREVLRTDGQVLWHAFALAAWCEAALGDGPDALRDILDVTGADNAA